MTVLVTGGGGFLGKNLVRALLDRGESVRVLARGEYPELASWGVETKRGDVADEAAVMDAAKGCRSVFHVAGRVGYWGRYAEYFATNVVGTDNVLTACRAHGVERMVYTSTPSVVIGPQGQIEGGDESTPFPPKYLSSYGPTKAEAERRVLAANGRDGLATAALRPHFIFGPGDPQIAPRVVSARREGKLVMIGDGSNLVDVTYIDNAVDAHLRLHDALDRADKAPAGNAYFIGQEEPVSLWEFVGKLLDGYGEPPVERRISLGTARAIGGLVEMSYRVLRLSGEPPLTRMAAVILGTSHYFRHDRATRDFGYAPTVGTDEGLRRFFETIEPRPQS